VGYGDKYPVTTAGRVVGVIVIVCGVGLFSALTSFLAHWFLRPRATDEQPQASSAPEIQDLNRLTALLRTYDVKQLLADTQRPPAEVLAELRPQVVAAGHGQPMAGADVADALKQLAIDFDRVARPERREPAA
jgi:hypothetical protein